MNPIDALKTAGPISVKPHGPTAKPKTETAPENGAFSKLLSSVSNEKSAAENSTPAELLAKLEEALDALEELKLGELQPEQQELLGAMIELLTLQAAQLETKTQGQNPDYVKSETGRPVQTGPNLENHAVNLQLQPKMVELMHQIAQKVQDLQSNTNKEFAVVPIFMGVEMEYILKEPKKVNETIKLLEEVVAALQNGQAEEGHTASAKLLGQAGELLKQAGGIAEGLEVQNPAPKPDSQPAAPVKLQTEVPMAQAAPADSAKAAQAPLRPEAPAPAPSVRMANLAEDLSGVLKSSLKLTGTGENAGIKVSIFPEHLGHLEIRLSTVDGKMAAQIFTSNLVAKEALDMQVYQLRNSLVQQGITVDRIEISQQPASQSFNQQGEQRFAQQQERQQERRHTLTKNGYQQLEEETAAFVRPAPSAGSVMSVDYTI